MKKTLMIALAVLSCAAISHASTATFTAPSTGWSGNSFETLDPNTVTNSTFYSLKYANTNGVLQTFDVTNTFTVANIRLWHTRYYDTNSITINIYSNANRGSSHLEQYAVSNNLLASIVVSPTTTHGSGNGLDVLDVELATNEQFQISQMDPSGTLAYLMQVRVTTAETNSAGSNLFLWNYANYDIYPGGAYANWGGGEVSGRELGMALVSTTPPPPPPPPTNLVELAPIDDTYVYNKGGDEVDLAHGDKTTLHIRSLSDTNGIVRAAYAYVKFNLGGITNIQDESSLTLTMSDGSQSYALGQMHIYGLPDSAGLTPQTWDETTLTWNTTGDELVKPTTTTNEPMVLTNLVYIGDFPVAAVGFPTTMSSTNLTAFLQTRLGSTATLVIVPEFNSNRIIYYNSANAATNQPVLSVLAPGGSVAPAFDPSISSISVGIGTVTLHWISDVNGTYRIEQKNTLSDSSWTPVAGASNLSAAGPGGTNTSFAASGGDAEFFRVYGE